MRSGPWRPARSSAASSPDIRHIPGDTPPEIRSRSGSGCEDHGLMVLSARERAILDFERDWWSRPGPKEAAIRTELGVSATRYYEILRHLVDVPEAYEYDPLTVKRVRRERDRRRPRRHPRDRRAPDPRRQQSEDGFERRHRHDGDHLGRRPRRDGGHEHH